MDKETEKSVQCLKCGTFNKENAKFCMTCGKPMKDKNVITTGLLSRIAQEQSKCPGCGAAVNPGRNFCPACGSSLKKTAGGGEVYRKSRDDKYIFEIGKKTDPGKKREINEDSFSTIEFTISENNQLTQIGLYMICDGMGGANAGEVASRLAVRSINSYLVNEMQKLEKDFELKVEGIIKESIKQADKEIRDNASKDPAKKGMGSTVVMVLAKGNTAYIYHVGDSRCYFISKTKMKQLTTDHTLLNVLLKKGVVKEEDKGSFKGRNVITNALGISIDVDSKLQSIKLEDGERLLLCSDGLSSYVEDKAVLRIAVDNEDSGKAVEGLVKAANDAGGNDNVTVILMKCARK